MTDQSIVVDSADFNGFRLRYLKGADPLFVFNDIAAALDYITPDGLAARASKGDIELMRLSRNIGESRHRRMIRWSRLCNLLSVTSEQRPEQSRSLRDFIIGNILPGAAGYCSKPRKRQRKDKLFIEQFGGDIVGWRNGSLVTTSAIIASETHYHHRDVMKAVSDHQSEIERFGNILFDQELFVTDNGLEEHKTAIFNEKQAVMLLTCMHKMQFRKDLSRVFYVKSQEKHIGVPLACPPVPDVPLVDVPASIPPSIEGRKVAWNKGKLVGQKLPLGPKEICAIRTRIQLAKQTRELALFNLAIDSQLRGCDLVELRVRDVVQGGRVSSRATIMQRKPYPPVQFELTEQTRDAVVTWILEAQLKPEQFLFPSRMHKSPHISIRQYAKIVDQWVTSIGLDRNAYGTNTMRRTQNLPAIPVRLPVQDIPASTKADTLKPVVEHPLDASRVAPVPPSVAAPVATALAVSAVEPFASFSANADGGSGNHVLTMSSLEMVEFINSQRKKGEAVLAHSDFLKKVPLVLGERVAGNFSGYYKALNGKQNPCYHFPKREACLMALSYSYEMQAKVFDRMTALEQQRFAIPQTLHEALRLAANLSEEKAVAVEKLAISDEKLAVSDAKLAIAEPKAEALDVIANTEGLLGLQETGRVLDQPPNLFVKWLRDEVKGWIHKRSYLSKNMPFRGKVIDGYLVVKSTPVPDYRNGGEKMESQTMVTPKGLTRIALLLKEIPPSYTIDKPIPTPKPRGLVRQAINRATKPVVPDMFDEMQAGQQEPLF